MQQWIWLEAVMSCCAIKPKTSHRISVSAFQNQPPADPRPEADPCQVYIPASRNALRRLKISTNDRHAALSQPYASQDSGSINTLRVEPRHLDLHFLTTYTFSLRRGKRRARLSRGPLYKISKDGAGLCRCQPEHASCILGLRQREHQ